MAAEPPAAAVEAEAATAPLARIDAVPLASDDVTTAPLLPAPPAAATVEGRGPVGPPASGPFLKWMRAWARDRLGSGSTRSQSCQLPTVTVLGCPLAALKDTTYSLSPAQCRPLMWRTTCSTQ